MIIDPVKLFLAYPAIISIFLFLHLELKGQENPYPQDVFNAPMDIPLYLSGTFGELRSNHFHSGIDIKTKGVEGIEIKSISDGHVSRIKVSPFGFGKAIYVDHPNGYTSVYAHLSRFMPEIDEYVNQIQYQKQSFAVDIYPDPAKFRFDQGQLIAYSGNTGGSGGAHLHFEIRETLTEIPINPLLFGFAIKDNIAPIIQQLALYELRGAGHNKQVRIINTKKGKNGYSTGFDTLSVNNRKTGIGIKAFDQLNGASNKNGIYQLELWVNDQLFFNYSLEKFSFDESRYINALIDYCHYKSYRSRIQRCYTLPGNLLSIYGGGNGVIELDNNESAKIHIKIKDASGNTSSLEFYLKNEGGKSSNIQMQDDAIMFNRKNRISKRGLELIIPPLSIYDTIPFKYSASNERSRNRISDVHFVHDNCHAVQYAYDISIQTDSIPEKLHSKTLLIYEAGNNRKYGRGGIYDSGWLHSSSRDFGKHYVMIDTTAPKIKLVNKLINHTIQYNRYISFKITDNLSGIQSYNAFVDGNWILMEYDPRIALIKGKIPENIHAGEHSFKLSVTDTRNNTAIYNAKIKK